MTHVTQAHPRDDLGFLIGRIPKLHPPQRARWLTIGMATCWLGSSALSLALSFGLLP